MIEQLTVKDLRVKVLDNNFKQLFSQVVNSYKFFHDEHISDILFDSGRKVIRIDWKQNKYVFYDYCQLHKEFIKRTVGFNGSGIHLTCYLNVENTDADIDRSLLLDGAKNLILITFKQDICTVFRGQP